jgi:hypothetical protein
MTNPPTPKDLAAARLYHELTAPGQPFNTGSRTAHAYKQMRKWLKDHHYVWTDGKYYSLQLTLFEEDRHEADNQEA